MILQVSFRQHLVNAAGGASPVVLRLRLGKREVEAEVGMLARQTFKILLVEDLLPRTGAIPIADAAAGVQGFKQVRQVRAQRGHARATADINHLRDAGFDVESAERTDGRHLVAGLETVDVRRADAGWAILSTRRGGNAD